MAATQSALEDVLVSSAQQQERKLMRPQPDQSLKCPRCDSTNTKFCYYNNYSLSQPRYFCKACRRYWTKGGFLRNVPVGGGCRKNKTRPSSSSKKSTQLPTNSNPLIPTSFPSLSTYDPNDLTLGFEGHTKQLGLLDDHDEHASSSMLMGSDHLNATHHHHLHCDFQLGNPCTAGTSTTAPGFLDAFRSSFLDAPSNNNLHNFSQGEMESFDCGDNSEDTVMPYKAESTMSTEKHEFYDGRDHGENRMFNWNFPWHAQLGSGEGNNMGSSTVDSERECWNGSLVGSSWHGLVNSSLM